MLTKILDYSFNLMGAPIDHSGRNNHGIGIATVAHSGPGGLRGVTFPAPQSRIEVPHNTSWNTIEALQIEIRVRLDRLDRRVNLIEITRCAALFIRTDGLVTFTIYAPNAGAGAGPASGIGSVTTQPPPTGSMDPFDTVTANLPEPEPSFHWIGLNTGSAFSPDGVDRTVAVGTWVTVRAIHDGWSSMRIYLDDVLAAERSDLTHAVPALLSPGTVTIGAWPHDGRYTLRGSIDFLRIWRLDPEFPARQFFCRPMSPKARACWLQLFGGLAKRFEDPETSQTIRALMIFVVAMLRDFQLAIDRAGEDARLRLRRLSHEYQTLWCAGRIDGPSMQSVMAQFVQLLSEVDPQRFDRLLPDLLSTFADSRLRELCSAGAPVADCDPEWVGFLQKTMEALPNPVCLSRTGSGRAPGAGRGKPADPYGPAPAGGASNEGGYRC